MDYEKQGRDFLEKTGTTIEVVFSHNGKHFDDDKDDKDSRDIYDITLKRGRRTYKFKFGNSINDSGFYIKKGVNKVHIERKYLNLSDSKLIGMFGGFGTSKDKLHRPKAPTAYSVLSCLTKNNPGTFEDFCSEFGYDSDSRSAKKTYKAVRNEYLEVSKLFSNEELEEMQEIQ